MTLARLDAVPGLAPPGGPYVHAVRGGNLLFISGQVAWGPDGEVVGVGDAVAQAEQAYANLGAILDAAGASFADVVMLRTYLVNVRDREGAGAVRRRFFGATLPASTLVEVSALAHPDLLIEVEAVALVSDPG